MTREEIYFDCLQIEMNGRDMLSPLVATYCRPEQTKAAHAAMEQYAKQEAIGFDRWKMEHNFTWTLDSDKNMMWYDVTEYFPKKFATHEELYNLYLQSKNQQP